MLTPMEIQNKTIKSTLGGYNKKETDEFLDTIVKNYEELYNENRELKEKVATLSEGVQYYKKMEGTLQKALILAEKTSSETQEAANAKAKQLEEETAKKVSILEEEAKTKADTLENEAKARATALEEEAKAKAISLENDAKAKADALSMETKEKMEKELANANQELANAKEQIRTLAKNYELYRMQFKKLASAQLDMLESDTMIGMNNTVNEIGMSDIDFSMDEPAENTVSYDEPEDNIVDADTDSSFEMNQAQDETETIMATKEDEPIDDELARKEAEEERMAESMVQSLASMAKATVQQEKEGATTETNDAVSEDTTNVAASEEAKTDNNNDENTAENTAENFNQMNYSDIFNTSAPVPETPLDKPAADESEEDSPFVFIDAK